MKKVKVLYLVVVLAVSVLLLSAAYAQTISEEAQRYFDRGMAAVEIAKSPDDYAPAIKEFEQAIRLAPDWPDVYYKLGMAQEKAGKYSDAITSLRQYLRLAPNASDAATVKSLVNKLEYKKDQEEGVKKVYEMMTSGVYTKKEGDCKLSGDKGIFYGPFYSYNSLNEFRNVMGKLEVQNIAFVYDRKYGGLYHPELRPRIPREWEPVKVNGNVYEYNYVYFVDVSSGHVAEIENEIKGEIISSNPPLVREVIKTTSKRGIRIPGETGRFIGGVGRAECIFEWKLK